MMLSASSSSSRSQSAMWPSMCCARPGSSFNCSITFSSRSKSLIAYQRRNLGSTLPSMLSSMCAMACSTLPSNTLGGFMLR